MTAKPKVTDWREAVSMLHSFVIAMVFTFSGLSCLCFGVWVLLRERNVELGLGASGAGVAFLFASMVGRFESFKVWGVEAKIRQLNETVDKAEVALAQLKKLTELTSLGMVRLYSGLGRFTEAPNMAELDQLASSVRSVLFQIGSSESDIRKALDPWVRTSALVAYRNLTEELSGYLEPIRIELVNRKQIALPDEQLTLMLRIGALEGYVSREAESVLACTPGEIAARIESLVVQAPELSVLARTHLSDLAAKAAKEVRHLVTNYELADKAYWNALRYQ